MPNVEGNFTTRIARSLARYLGTEDFARKTTETSARSGFDARLKRLASQLRFASGSLGGSTRKAKYEDYKYLDENLAEAFSALNLYADNVVSGSIGGAENYKVVVGEDTQNIEQIEEVIRYNERRSNIKDTVWEIARDVSGYGDEFREIIIAEDDLTKQLFISKLKHLPVKEIFANVDSRGIFMDPAKMYVQKQDQFDAKTMAAFEWWRLIHFKIGSGIYGFPRSIFAGAATRIGRQLLWVDEALVIARMSRAWQRYAYLIDVEGLTPDDAWEYVETFMSQMTRKELVDPVTGRISVADRPPLPDEDLGIPVRKDSKQDIKILSGDPNIGHIEDMKYLQSKFFMVVSVPKAYMAIEEGVRAKATIQQIDVQFARQVRRRQSSLIPGLRKFYKVAFVLNNIDPNSFKWEIVFPELATTDEMLKWELEKTKAEIAKIYMIDVGALNNDWLFKEVLQFPEAKAKKYAAQAAPPGAKPGFPVVPVEGISLSPHLAAAIRKNPELRQILDDLKDIISYKVARDQSLDGMREVDKEK